MSQITDLFAQYASGSIDFPTVRQTLRQITSTPPVATDPWLQADNPNIEGGPLEILAAAFTFDLSEDEYHQSLLSLHGQPIGAAMPVDTSGGIGLDATPQPAGPTDWTPTDTQEPAEPSSPGQPGQSKSSFPNGPASLQDLLEPSDGRPFIAPIAADDAPGEDDEERDKVRKRLARVLKHYAPTHDTGTGQEVHAPGGGGGGGEDSKPDSTTPPQIASAEPDSGFDPKANAPRPRLLDDMIGQDNIRERVKIMLDSAKARSDNAPHMLFTGPPGLGKTTFARAIANEMGVEPTIIVGGSLKTPEDVSSLLLGLKEGSVLFIDEIHAMSPTAQEMLYPAVEDFELSGQVGSETYTVQLPKFTLLGATTNPEGVLRPLRDRFGSPQQLDYYEPKDLAKITSKVAKSFGMEMDDEVANMIGERGRGTPRLAINLTKWVRDFSLSRNQPVSASLVNDALSMWEIDSKGLTTDDRKVMSALQQQSTPMGLNTVASMTGLDDSTIQSVVEPYLLRLGYIQKTPRGRIITDAGRQHLDSVNFEKRTTVAIVKRDDRRNLVFGWANVAFTPDGQQVEDHQGHLIDLEDLESAAYDYVVKYRLTGDMHQGDGFGELVESMVVTEDKVEKAGFPRSMLGHWWVGFRVPPEHWDAVQKGDRVMFSIQGKARLEPFEEEPVAKHAVHRQEDHGNRYQGLNEVWEEVKEGKSATARHARGAVLAALKRKDKRAAQEALLAYRERQRPQRREAEEISAARQEILSQASSNWTRLEGHRKSDLAALVREGKLEQEVRDEWDRAGRNDRRFGGVTSMKRKRSYYRIPEEGPVAKHAMHNQKDHGNWADGSKVDDPVDGYGIPTATKTKKAADLRRGDFFDDPEEGLVAVWTPPDEEGWMRVQRVRDRTKLSPRGTGKRVFDPDSDFEVFYEPQVDVKVRESEYAYPDGRRIKVGVGGRTGITRTVTFSDGKARSTTSFKRYSSEFLHQGDELVPVRLDWYTGKITREDS